MSNDGRGKKFIEFGLTQWLGLALVAIAIVFIAQNISNVSIALLWVTVSSPLWLVLAIVALVGFGAGYLLAWGRGRRRR